MFKRFAATAALVAMAATAVPLPVAAFTGRKGTQAAQINDKVFEVSLRRSGDGQAYWCGAADYARRVLKAPWSARIFVVRGEGPSVNPKRRNAVQFTLDPGGAGVTPTGPSLSLNRMLVGDSMTIQKANVYCTSNSIVF